MNKRNGVFRKFFLTLIFAFSLSGLMGQLQIGTGTANEYLPIRPWWAYSYSQVIYLQSEINASGNITELQWYFNGSSLSNSNDWTIYIGHTSKTEFSSGSDWIAVSSLTQVWDGTFADPGSSGWISFDISDFYYNNSDNLVIAVDENKSDDNGYSDYFHNSSVSTYRGLVEYASSNIDPESPPTGTRKKYIANIKIVMGSSTCPAPSDLTETNITQSTVDLGWTENGSATTWDIEYGAAGFSLGTGTQVTGITSNPYSLSGLTAHTEYDWYVRSDCGGGDASSWTGPGNFATLAAVQSLPFTEDWENGNIGSAWNTYTAGYALMQVNAASKHNGSYGLEQYADGGSYTTPSGLADAYTKAQPGGVNASHTSWNYFSIDLSAATAPELSFWYALGRSFNNNYNFFWLQIDDGSGWSDLFATQPDGDPVPYEKKTFDLSSYTGGTVDIRFFHNGKYDDDYLYLDDISISEFTCPAPSGQLVSNISTISVDLEWTENGTSTSWDIEWGAPGFTQGTGTMISGTISNPYSLSGLSANTAYDWYVRSDCGSGSSSSWVGPHTFSTSINSFPWTEGFENGGSIPDGWTQEYVSGTHNWVFQTGGHNNSNPSNAHTGTYNAAFTHTSSGTKTKLITPQLDLDGQSNPQLRFWHTQAVYDGDQDELRVYYKTSAGGSWTMIAEYTSSITSWTQEIINLPNTSSTYYIAFEGYDDYGYGVCVDDVEVVVSSCPAPSSLYADNINKSSADLNWTTGGASTWNIEYGPEGFAQGAGTMITGTTSNPYLLSGLTAGTAYDFYVQDDCGGGSQSSWSGPSSFTTVCDAVNTFPWTEDFENGGSRPDCWSEEYNVGSHNWVFQDGGNIYPLNAHSGSYNAAFIHENTSSSTKLITPPLDLSSLSNPQVSFWHAQVEDMGDQDELRVYYKTSLGGSWTLIPGAEYTSEVSDWTEVVLGLPNPSAEYFIAFEGTDGYGQGICIDDVEVDGNISCLPPTNLFVNNIDSTSVDLNWTTGGASTWNIEWGPAGFVQGTGTLITGTTNNPYSLSGLSANTAYDFYVQDDCGGSQSTWTGPATFCTVINIFPWTEGFENGGNRPEGWTEEYVSGTIDWNFLDGGDGGMPANAHDGSYNAEFSFNSGDATMLITPVFDLTALGDPILDFWHTQHEFMGGQSTLTVYYRISESDPWTMVPGGNFTTEFDEWTSEILDLPSSSATYQIAFKATDGGGTGVCVDDVRIMDNTPMQWVSSTCTQNTDYSYRANYQQIIGIEIETQYMASPIEITSFRVNTNGGTVYFQNINDFSIYYTGTTNVFDERNLFNVETINPPSGGPTNYDIDGSQILTEGTNYFWLAVNVEPTAVPGETIDAECLQITTASGNIYVPDITAPAGSSEIHEDMEWTGANSNEWDNSGNWDPPGPPDTFIPIVVPYDATNNLQLNGDLVVHGYGGDYNCYSLEIQLAATVTNTGDLDCFGDMEVAGTYTSTNNTSNSHKINSGGELYITTSGVVNFGNNVNGEADLIIGHDNYSGGTLMNIGGELYVADQIYLHDNATVITGSQAIIFAGKGGGGSDYSSDNPATFFVEEGALGNIMNATIKVCGKTEPGFYTVNIQSDSFNLSSNAVFEICHGDNNTHYDADIFVVDNVELLNFKVNKPGNTITVKSNITCSQSLNVKPGASLIIDSGNTVNTGQ